VPIELLNSQAPIISTLPKRMQKISEGWHRTVILLLPFTYGQQLLSLVERKRLKYPGSIVERC
jgi:hypothetical protein